MAIKPFHTVNSSNSLESKVKDSQQNLLEFTLMATGKMDFSSFDVLSITRADLTPNYQCKKLHRKVSTQAVRIDSQNARIIPWPKRR